MVEAVMPVRPDQLLLMRPLLGIAKLIAFGASPRLNVRQH